jgi:hypothetical protein
MLLLAIVGVVLILAGWKVGERTVVTSSVSLIAVLIVLTCGVVTALAPPTSIDEVSNTLAVPRTWALEGRAVELPLLAHSYFPLGIESADLAPIAILDATRGGVASHLLHLFAAIAAAFLIYRRTESWFLTAAIVTTPALAIIAGWSLGEWPLVGLFVATFVALDGDNIRDDVRTASAATAAGLLTSYVFAPFALVAWILRRRRPHWIALLGLLFFIRNLILTWNPVAPFFSEDAPAWMGFRTLALSDYVFHPDFLGVALLALPFFATGAIAIAAAAIGLGLFFLAPPARVLVPFLVIPSLTAKNALQKKMIAIPVAIAIAAQTLLLAWFTARGGAFSMLTASTSIDAYLRKQRPAYASIAWLNETIPAGSRTLVIGIDEMYWFAKPVRGGAAADAPRITRYLGVPTPEALRERLRRDGITHVAVVTSESPIALEAGGQKMLAQTLDRYAATVTTRGHATLFTLR